MDFSPNQIQWVIQAIIILVLSICVHEWGHAVVADKLGDPTPRGQGRVTLNPTRHADPIGTLAFPLLALLATRGMSLGFGWGRPVQIQPHLLSRRFSMRTANMLVALAGPAMNVVLGTAIALVHVLLLKFGVIESSGGGWPPRDLSGVLYYAAFLNFILFFFNLIPAHPLDGGAVIEGLLPERHVPAFQKFSVYGPFVLMAVIFIPGASRIFVAPAQACVQNLHGLLYGIFL